MKWNQRFRSGHRCRVLGARAGAGRLRVRCRGCVSLGDPRGSPRGLRACAPGAGGHSHVVVGTQDKERAFEVTDSGLQCGTHPSPPGRTRAGSPAGSPQPRSRPPPRTGRPAPAWSPSSAHTCPGSLAETARGPQFPFLWSPGSCLAGPPPGARPQPAAFLLVRSQGETDSCVFCLLLTRPNDEATSALKARPRRVRTPGWRCHLAETLFLFFPGGLARFLQRSDRAWALHGWGPPHPPHAPPCAKPQSVPACAPGPPGPSCGPWPPWPQRGVPPADVTVTMQRSPSWARRISCVRVKASWSTWTWMVVSSSSLGASSQKAWSTSKFSRQW